MFEKERIARILRGETERINRLEQEREMDGSVNVVRFTDEGPRLSFDGAEFSTQGHEFTYGNRSWGFATYEE